MEKIKLFNITTIPLTQLLFLRGQNQFMKSKGFEVHGVSSPGQELEELAKRDDIQVHAVSISRKITPIRDLFSLIMLWKIFITLKPTIVHLSTPKAALLGSIASKMAFVPIRIFFVRGLITENAKGIRRILFNMLEKLTSKLCTKDIFVSPSLKEFALSEGITSYKKATVFHNGMSNGIDCSRFDPDNKELIIQAKKIRKQWNITSRDDGDLVMGYVGRLERDKGIHEIYHAWLLIRKKLSNIHLLMVGPWYDSDPVSPNIKKSLEQDPCVHFTGMVKETPPYYALMDVLVLPSYREGFPNAPMEASAMRVPVVATRVTGCVDAVVDGETGILVPARDAEALADAIIKLLGDPELREKMGKAGRERVLRDFRPEDIWEALYQEYVKLLREKGLVVPESIKV